MFSEVLVIFDVCNTDLLYQNLLVFKVIIFGKTLFLQSLMEITFPRLPTIIKF